MNEKKRLKKLILSRNIKNRTAESSTAIHISIGFEQFEFKHFQDWTFQTQPVHSLKAHFELRNPTRPFRVVSFMKCQLLLSKLLCFMFFYLHVQSDVWKMGEFTNCNKIIIDNFLSANSKQSKENYPTNTRMWAWHDHITTEVVASMVLNGSIGIISYYMVLHCGHDHITTVVAS